MNVIEEIAAERQRQKDVEGWTEAHDDSHAEGEMARAAACYAHFGSLIEDERVPANWQHENIGEPQLIVTRRLWPWDWSWWKPKDRRRDLIRAAALIVAEIERLDRLPTPAGDE
ncbi:hypothetical protein [Albimonas pacifica]|uniref:Uncharacterized protein n=1 Tax=Albimonas pacifica TaxID=1114924 RepID=A0A1I3LK23_9RHOB|nr:hypothetical protein [Albimonas pacifica]SFI85084.1 hypothetical protein SAMN05216258_11068 [Albimonas pacifica]